MKTIIILFFALSAFSLSAQSKTYLFVHGAWHGAWCWKKVVPLIEAEGNRAFAIDLPGHGEDKSSAAAITLDDYVKKVVAVANAQQGSVILVGHSMAGVVISQAAEVLGKEKVSKLIYLDAFLPKDGESVLMLAEKAGRANGAAKSDGPSLMESLVFSSDQKTSMVKPDAVAPLFYHDCSAQDVAFAKEHVGWQSMACLATPVHVTSERYGAIPKYYILCTKAKDLDKSSLVNNMHCEKVVKLESSHSPFFSMPEKLAEIINGI